MWCPLNIRTIYVCHNQVKQISLYFLLRRIRRCFQKKNVIVIDLTWLHMISRDCIYMGQWYAFFTRCFFLPAAPSCQRHVLEVSETNLQERNFKKQTCQLWIQQSTSHLCIWFLSSDLIEKWPVRFLGLIQQETHVRMPWKKCSKKRS